VLVVVVVLGLTAVSAVPLAHKTHAVAQTTAHATHTQSHAQVLANGVKELVPLSAEQLAEHHAEAVAKGGPYQNICVRIFDMSQATVINSCSVAVDFQLCDPGSCKWYNQAGAVVNTQNNLGSITGAGRDWGLYIGAQLSNTPPNAQGCAFMPDQGPVDSFRLINQCVTPINAQVYASGWTWYTLPGATTASPEGNTVVVSSGVTIYAQTL